MLSNQKITLESYPDYSPSALAMRVKSGGTIRVDPGATLDIDPGATVTGIVAAELATTVSPGQIEIATNAEADAGAAPDKAVVPANLPTAVPANMPAATATAAGIAELATDAEAAAIIATDKVLVPANLSAVFARLSLYSFAGRNGAGACVATGTQAGDLVYAVSGLTDKGAMDAKFESVVTVNDQVQQVAAEDLSAKNFMAFVYRPG